jgi:hypothetical protein
MMDMIDKHTYETIIHASSAPKPLVMNAQEYRRANTKMVAMAEGMIVTRRICGTRDSAANSAVCYIRY